MAIKVILKYDEDFAVTNLWVIEERSYGRFIMLPFEMIMEPFPESYVLPKPTMQFRGHDATEFLQSLANGLAEAGFKPDKVKECESQITAVHDHLQDMKKIV